VAASSWREPSPPAVLTVERCKACRRRLGDFDGKGRAEIVCPKCGVMNTIRPK
jgi:phage FluMu protein Com